MRVHPRASVQDTLVAQAAAAPGGARDPHASDLAAPRQINAPALRKPPSPPIASPLGHAARYALSPHQCDAVIAAVTSAAAAFPQIQANIIHREADRPGLLREAFGSRHHAEHVFQFSFLVPRDMTEKDGMLALLTGRLAAIGVSVTDAGGAVLIGDAKVDKSLALRDYAERLGISPEAIAKFGDKAGPGGNDRHLAGPSAYNVGNDEPACGLVNNRARGRHAAGTIEIAHELIDTILADRAAGRTPTTQAFMFDFDGTLTNPGEKAIGRESLALLARLLENDIAFSICTGRGPAIFPMLVEEMARGGADPEAMCRLMTLFMFNGGRWVESHELAELLRG